jgi:hypothetical protein
MTDGLAKAVKGSCAAPDSWKQNRYRENTPLMVERELSLGAEAMDSKGVVRVIGEWVLIPGRPAFDRF